MSILMEQGVNQVTFRITEIFDERRKEINRILLHVSQKMLRDFRAKQDSAEKKDPKKAERKRRKWQEVLRDDIKAVLNKGAALKYAKAHSGGAPYLKRGVPWINRTMRAARSVHGYVDVNNEYARMGLYHKMPYGAYLEFAHNRKYAVIEPLLRQYAIEALKEIRHLFGDKA